MTTLNRIFGWYKLSKEKSVGKATRIGHHWPLTSFNAVLAALICLLLLLSGQKAQAQSGALAYVVNSGSDNVSVISLSTDTVIATIPVGDSPNRVVVTPNGQKAYVVNSNSNDVSVINTTTHTVVATIPVGTGPRALDVSADGSRVYVANGLSNDVSVIDTATDMVILPSIPISVSPAAPYGCAFNPEDSEVWVGVGGGSNVIKLFAHPSQADLGSIPGVIGSAEWMDFLPDGSFAFVNNGCGCCGNLQKISTASNSVVSTFSFDGAGVGLAIAPDGSAVYAGTNGHCGGGGPQIKKLDPSSNTPIDSLLLPAEGPGGMAVTSDGNFLYATVVPLNQVFKVNTSDMTLVTTIPVGTSPVDVAILPPGPVDATPPVVNVSFPSPDGQNDWFVTSPVVGSVTADDTTNGGSNITAINCTGATVGAITGLGTPNASAPLTISAEGANPVSCTAADSASNSGAAAGSNNTATVMIDSVAPSITPGTPPAGSPYLLNQSVSPSFACTDDVSGSGFASASGGFSTSGPNSTDCTGPSSVNISAVGSQSYGPLVATDIAGNSTPLAGVAYNVNYNFNGFFPPVDNLPTLNRVKAGSVVPVKFSLNGDQGLNILAAGYPQSQTISCDSNAPLDDISETVTAGSSELSYDAGADQYTYVWKTDKAWAGICRQLTVKLNDGTSHLANFNFTK